MKFIINGKLWNLGFKDQLLITDVVTDFLKFIMEDCFGDEEEIMQQLYAVHRRWA